MNQTEQIVIPNTLLNYQRITKDPEVVKKSSTRMSQIFAKLINLISLLGSFLSKKSENLSPISIIVNNESNALLERIQLPRSVYSIHDCQNSINLEYGHIVNLLKTLNHVRTDCKILKEAKIKLTDHSKESLRLRESYDGTIQALQVLEIELEDAISALEKQSNSSYLSDLKAIKTLEFPGYPAGFLKIKDEVVDIFLEIITGEQRTEGGFTYSDYPEEIIPLLINIDALTGIVSIWDQYPSFEDQSSFSESQIRLIRGVVESFSGKEVSIFYLEEACSKKPLLFEDESKLLEILSKVSSGSLSSLTATERRIFQLLVLQLPRLEASGKYSAIVNAIKSNLVRLATFSEFKQSFEKEFFPLSTLNQQKSDDLLFEIYYICQDKFSSLSSEERMIKLLSERKSVFVRSTTEVIKQEKLKKIEVDGETVEIPSELEGWLDKGNTIIINGQAFPKSDSQLIDVVRAIRDLATTQKDLDQELFRSLLNITGFGSEPQIRVGVYKALSLAEKDYKVSSFDSTLPHDLFLQITKSPEGAITVKSRSTYMFLDKTDTDNQQLIGQKVHFEQEFVLSLEEDAYLKTDVEERLEIENMSQDAIDQEYIAQIQVPENVSDQDRVISQYPASVKQKISQQRSIQTLILDEMIADLSYNSSRDTEDTIREKQLKYARQFAEMSQSPAFGYSMTKDRFRALSEHFSQEAMTIAFAHLSKKYEQVGKLFLRKAIDQLRNEYKTFNIIGFKSDISKAISITSNPPALLSERTMTDLLRRSADTDYYVQKDKEPVTVTGKTEQEYYDSLVTAMGGVSSWIMSVSAFYSQLLPNQVPFTFIGSSKQEATNRANIQKVFGIGCYLMIDHIRSVITIKEIDDTHKEVVCRDYLYMKLSENSHVSGIEIIPQDALYFESRIILEKDDADAENPFKAKEFSASICSEGKTSVIV